MKLIKATDINRQKNWKVILYGKPGVGKTTAIKNLKGKTLVIDLDNSSKVLAKAPNITVDVFDRTKPAEDIEETIRQLPDLIKNYDNLVIDNVSSFERDWFVEKGRNSKNGISNEIQDYSQWTNYFSRIMAKIYMLPNINILTTSWEKQHRITSASGQEFDQYGPQLRDSVRDGLLGLADAVGRMIISPDTGKRGVILQGDDGVFAKNRLDNRKAAPIDELFDWGDVHVQTASVPKKAGQPSKTKLS